MVSLSKTRAKHLEQVQGRAAKENLCQQFEYQLSMQRHKLQALREERATMVMTMENITGFPSYAALDVVIQNESMVANGNSWLFLGYLESGFSNHSPTVSGRFLSLFECL
jgi:hypothetical protein